MGKKTCNSFFHVPNSRAKQNHYTWVCFRYRPVENLVALFIISIEKHLGQRKMETEHNKQEYGLWHERDRKRRTINEEKGQDGRRTIVREK